MYKYRKGNIVKGIVTGITEYGIFVSFDEYYTGLVHISEISHFYVKNIGDFVTIGEEIYVKILEVNEEENQLSLSIKDVNYKVVPNKRKKKIKETTIGFKTLSYKLPYWIEEGLKRYDSSMRVKQSK